MSRFRYSFSQPWSWHRRPQLPHQQRAPPDHVTRATSAEGIARGRVQPSTRAICLRVTSFEATSNVAVRKCSSMRLLVAWRWAWRSIVVTICSSSPVASPDRHIRHRSGETVKSYDFVTDGTSLINDVTLTGSGAWFTDSTKAMLYFVEVSKRGELGASRTVNLTGPAAELSGQFNLNGIAAANGGRTLIVSHSANGALYTVDPKTGASAAIAGISVPSVDGIVLSGRRLWAVQNSNQITRILLNDDLTAGTVEKVITSDPSRCRARRHGSATGWRSSTRRFDTGDPPTADQYEVVLVNG